jgi:hypothetical protein
VLERHADSVMSSSISFILLGTSSFGGLRKSMPTRPAIVRHVAL